MKTIISTIFGILAGFSILIFGVLEVSETTSIVSDTEWLVQTTYWRPASFSIVLGGVLSSVFTMYPPRYVFKAIGQVLRYFNQSTVNAKTLRKDIDMVTDWSDRINDNKLKALQEIQAEHENELPAYLFSLVSTNYDTEDIESFGRTNIEEHYDREMINVETLRTMGSASPAFGMFGTLFGLVMLLGELQNPAAMGPGLATALITTLYGIALAHLIFFPCARKLRNIAQIKRFREYLLLDGVLMINDERSNFYIRDKLNSYLSRDYSFNEKFEEAATSEKSKAA